MGKSKSVLIVTGRAINEVLSFVIFSLLDVLDFILCYVYRVADFFIEAEWKPCYCSPAKEAITSSGNILVSEQGESKIVCLSSSRLQLEDISDTLFTRPSLVSEVSKSTVNELKRLKLEGTAIQSSWEKIKRSGKVRSTFTVNSTIVEMLHGKIRGQQSHPVPRWSDCDCKTCTSWTSSSKETLFVLADGAKGKMFNLVFRCYHTQQSFTSTCTRYIFCFKKIKPRKHGNIIFLNTILTAEVKKDKILRNRILTSQYLTANFSKF